MTAEPEVPLAPEADPPIEVEQVATEELADEDEIKRRLREFGEYDPTLDLSRFKLPHPGLLQEHGNSTITIDQAELEENKKRILDTLGNYGIEISKIKATIGPTVTLYEIVPAAGVRISKIKNLEDDIALNLAALGIRIIAPIPGRGTIGIEVPNARPTVVSMKNLVSSERFQASDFELPVVLGKTINNETFLADLAKMPHLLMAGATGQGKSVGLNVILSSLLFKKHPAQVKFVLVDPKKVELTLFNKIERHYLAKLPGQDEAIITDTRKVINTLNSLCMEMDDRYELLKNAMVRNIKEYNHKFTQRRLNPEEGHRYLPYIVLVIDEFADLIMTAGKEVETPIARLAQLARAIGIHLIIATQRPSVNVITGIIKANFPARIAFRVTSKIDSRTILDMGGADQLIGKGDMLFSTGNDLIRIQCAFIDTPEVEQLTEYIGSQQGYPEAYLLPEYESEEGGSDADGLDPSERDKMFADAARVVVIHQQGSASLLQRKLKLGYNRAGRIIDQLEAAGVVGPFTGSKARQVLIQDETSLEQLLNRGN
jgi:S-DNA-T family DNA segregation ATPase FtsK/SpoIIIE